MAKIDENYMEGGGGGGGGGGHEFEPLYSFIFSLLLILMRVFSKYLILIHRL